MEHIELLYISFSGLFAGVLAGFLGIGGGVVMIPVLVTLGYQPVQAVGTTTLSILITAISGSIQNLQMGNLTISRVIAIGFPALITAQLGVYLENQFSSRWLLFAFGLFLILNIYLVEFRKQVTKRKKEHEELEQNLREDVLVKLENRNNQDFAEEFALPITDESLLLIEPIIKKINSQIPEKYMKPIARITTGSLAGLLAGLFGLGGGVILVPLQILLLGEKIKVAIPTSLGVIVITAFSACIGHAVRGNVLWETGLLLGFSGLLGVQFSTRYMKKLPDEVISFAFRALLAIISIYIFWEGVTIG